MVRPIPKGIKHIPTFASAGLILVMTALAGLLYSSSGSVLFGPESAVILDGALIIGTVMICATVVVLLIDFP